LTAYFAALPAIKPKDLPPQVGGRSVSLGQNLKDDVPPQLHPAGGKNRRHRRRHRQRAELSGPVK
jgi:hypothetical protein